MRGLVPVPLGSRDLLSQQKRLKALRHLQKCLVVFRKPAYDTRLASQGRDKCRACTERADESHPLI